MDILIRAELLQAAPLLWSSLLRDLRCGRPGRRYKGKARLPLRRWRFWRDGLSAVVSWGKNEEMGFGQECRTAAAKAGEMTDALGGNTTF